MATAAISSSSIISQLRSKILLSGPIPVADYMRLALTQSSQPDLNLNLKHQGYYMKKDVFGQQGDFITSPEISQIFGELIGVWCVQLWKQLRGPKKFNLVELGPGRGTLTKDMLRIFNQFERIIGSDVNVNLVEISPFLSKLQHNTLCSDSNNQESTPKNAETGNAYQHGLTQNSKYPVSWYKDIRDVPKEFSVYIAHEFFDALPIHKLQKDGDDWREVLVDISPDEKDMFRFVLSRNETPVLKVLRSRYPQMFDTPRKHLEVSLDALVILDEITTRLDEFGGIAVIVDYGHEGNKDDTFRAFRNHQLHDPLVDPGSADLTADVNFSIIKQLFHENALICGPVTQREFLTGVGIDVRLDHLLRAAKTDDQKDQLKSGYKMIMEDMGTRFKVISLFPKVLEQYLPRLKIPGFHNE